MDINFTGNPITMCNSNNYDRCECEDRPVKVEIQASPFDIDPRAVQKSIGVQVNLNLTIESDADLDRLDSILSRLGQLC